MRSLAGERPAAWGRNRRNLMAGGKTSSCVRIWIMPLACLCLAQAWLTGASRDGAGGADQGLRQAFERARYSLRDAGHGTWQGVNAAQRLTLEFNPRETRLTHPDGSVTFHLTGFGYGDRLHQ